MQIPAFRTSRWLSSRFLFGLSLVAALVLSLPMTQAGFVTDDYVYVGILEGLKPPAPLPNTRFDLFRYMDGNPSTLEPLVRRGVYPWWSLPELKLAFWRPLSSALMVVDQSLFGRQALGWQLHSILWYLAVVALAGVLLVRRLLPGAVGALALLLFAVDEAHAVPVGWISNRNALVATALGLLGLWMHLEWRERGRTWAMPLSVVGLGLGLAGGEVALGLFAYVACYELLGARGTFRQRFLALVPAGLLGLGYLITYKALGYGSFGSGFYVDPAGQPGAWLRASLTRVPALLSGLLLSLPADLASGDTVMELGMVAAGLVGVVLVGWMLFAAWPGLTEDERRHVRWLLAGAALSVLPMASTLPSNRLLMVPSFGAAVAAAVALTHVWRWGERAWRPRALALGASVLALLHLGLAPWGWWSAASSFRDVSAFSDRIHHGLEQELDQSRLAGQRVAVLATPTPMVGMYASVRWWMEGHVLPRAWWTLSFSPHVHHATRTGPATLEVELERGRFLTSQGERLYRGADFPLVAGHEVDLQGVRVKVLEVDGEGPRRLGLTFDVPLEDPSLVLMQWKEGALHRMEPPAVGSQVAFNIRTQR